MKRPLSSFLVLLLATLTAVAQSSQPKPFTIDELVPIRRVGDPQLSPDGRWVAFTITDR